MAGGPVPKVTGHRYEFILNQSVDSITLINSEHVYELVNDSYCKAIGKSRDAILGHSVADIWGSQRYETEISLYLSRCLSGEIVSYIQRFKFGTEKRYMQVTFYPYEQDGNGITHALVFSRDLTRLGELENRIVHYESRDPHTGLFNRKSLEMLLDMEILKAQKDPKNQLRGLLFIGIENLTDINRNLGHDIGDYLIENTGLRIRESIRNGDFVFQFQHDELVVILSYLAKASDAALVADKLIHAIGAPYRYQDNDVALACRIGVALYPDDANDQRSLVRHAIAALNEAVRTKSPYKLYDAGMHALAAERFSMEAHLRQALEDSQFELFFQPIVAACGDVEGVEALIRWNHPERGVVPPGEFIHLAAENGLLKSISRWVLFSAIRKVGALYKHHQIYVSVNLTASDLEDENIVHMVDAALKQRNGLPASALKVEITESECMERADVAIPRIQALEEMGVQVYVDDFGTGQSSLSYLKDLPASAIKIDRSFVEALLDHPEDVSFLDHIIHLVKLRGKRVIAEGVTSSGQERLLKTLGCDALQGFRYSKPIAAADLKKFLSKGIASSSEDTLPDSALT